MLRSSEVKNETYVDTAGLTNDYDQAQVFDAAKNLKAITWIPGRPYLLHDQTFIIFHRKPDAGQKPPE